LYEQLNTAQKCAVTLALEGSNFFLTGSAGTGKSFCLEAIIEMLRRTGKKVEPTATTGIAAVNIGGSTLHSFAGIGIGEETRDELKRKAMSKKLRDIWMNVDVLIIDEISMLDPDFFEKISLVAQVARQDGSPFGGVQVIGVGDFFQLPPVVPKMKFSKKNSTVSDTPNMFAFESDLWKQTFKQTVELRDVFRQSDPVFVRMLQRIRWGEVTQEDMRILTGRLGARIGEAGVAPTFLHSRVEEVERINSARLNEITHAPRSYHMVDGYIFPKEEAADELPSTLKVNYAIGQLRKNVPVEHTLQLKAGAQVMLLVNLSTEHGLVNGSRGVVTRFTDTTPIYPVVRFQTGNEVVIRAYMWKKFFRNRVYAYVAQIPLKLAYAFTIHKSQGQSLDCAEIQLDDSIFDEGQAYTALSRVRSLQGLSLRKLSPGAIRANPRVIKFYTALGQNPLQKIMSRIIETKREPSVTSQSDEESEEEEAEDGNEEEEEEVEDDHGHEDEDEEMEEEEEVPEDEDVE